MKGVPFLRFNFNNPAILLRAKVLRFSELPSLFFLIITSLFFVGCSPKVYEKMKSSGDAIIIDGDLSDWGETLRFYDKKSLLFYEIRNDNQNLYFAFGTYDKNTQIRILTRGILIEIDSLKQRTYPISIAFPVMDRKHVPMPGKIHSERPDSLKRPEIMEISDDMMQIKLQGFNQTVPESVISVRNKYGINAGLKREKENYLFCEMMVPFNTFYKSAITVGDTIIPFYFRITLEQGNMPGMMNGQRPQGPPKGFQNEAQGEPGSRPMPGDSPGNGSGNENGEEPYQQQSFGNVIEFGLRFTMIEK